MGLRARLERLIDARVNERVEAYAKVFGQPEELAALDDRYVEMYRAWRKDKPRIDELWPLMLAYCKLCPPAPEDFQTLEHRFAYFDRAYEVSCRLMPRRRPWFDVGWMVWVGLAIIMFTLEQYIAAFVFVVIAAFHLDGLVGFRR